MSRNTYDVLLYCHEQKGMIELIDDKHIDNNNKQEIPTIKSEIGKTTYVVGIHFSKTSKETLKDKIKRMVLQDVKGK